MSAVTDQFELIDSDLFRIFEPLVPSSEAAHISSDLKEAFCNQAPINLNLLLPSLWV